MPRTTPGKRERLARKRRKRRTIIYHFHDGSVVGSLKVGRRHYRRCIKGCLACMVDHIFAGSSDA